LKFCIISCVHNGEQFIRDHLDSVKCQKDCGDFVHIVIDDGSMDATPEILEIEQRKRLKGEFVYIPKDERTGGLHSFLLGLGCPLIEPEDVVVELDGDDYFTTDTALARIKKEYDDGALATYGNYETKHDPSKYTNPPPDFITNSICKPIVYGSPRDQFREGKWVYSAVRTAKKWVIDKIPPSYFLDESGELYHIKDLTYFLPVLELVGMENVRFVEDVIMVYNLYHGNDFMGEIQEGSLGIGTTQIYEESQGIVSNPPLAKLVVDKQL
jgi:glycosyltransferase involved in cell wall biosynthesis